MLERQDEDSKQQLVEYIAENESTSITVWMTRPADFPSPTAARAIILKTLGEAYPTSDPRFGPKIAGTDRDFLIPTTAADATKPSLIYVVGNLNENVAYSLIKLKALSTPHGSFFILPAKPANYRLATILTGLYHGPNEVSVARNALAPNLTPPYSPGRWLWRSLKRYAHASKPATSW
jgi:hypothetical protein